ncbi:MAG: hypothetical protein JST68_11440 [Bacteroidetes bacterium]|nr:hypothetical protein [Bacteroidota bacterium]
MKPLFFILTLLTCACHKSNDSNEHLLGTRYDRLIKLNQATIIYDSTALRDSADFADPPTTRVYDWKISPNDGCSIFWGNKSINGIATISFRKSGVYRIAADIHDSLTNRLIAHTNTMTIQVSRDTLYTDYGISPDDILKISPTLLSSKGGLYDGMQLVCTTTRSYREPYLQLTYEKSIGTRSYSFTFSDRLHLFSFPFTTGYNNPMPGETVLELPGFTNGMTANLNIVWLGIPRTGTITLTDKGYYLNWDSQGAVRFPN